MKFYKKLLKFLIFITIGILTFISWLIIIKKYHLGKWYANITITYFFATFIHFSYRAILTLFYKPYKKENDFLPPVSIIIPVYNEGKMIKKALLSAIRAKYKGYKEIICIDDGSTDETTQYILEVKELYPDSFKFIRFDVNRGKREALAHGIKLAKGEIIITLDSDTVLSKQGINLLISPFRDKKIGAVTGRIKVFNKNKNFLTKMIGVRYIIASDLYHATQSVIKTVMVCSGVMSAYRKSLLENVLNQWLSQEFLGRICTHGDDRALTNLIIKNGYDTVYSQYAVAHTLVPERIGQLIKMAIRWNRSYIRESIVFLSFIFNKINKKFKLLAIFDFISSNFLLLFQYVVIISSAIVLFISPPVVFNFTLLISLFTLLFTLLYTTGKRKSDVIYSFFYQVFSTIFLSWVTPYALFSLKNRSWLTR